MKKILLSLVGVVVVLALLVVILTGENPPPEACTFSLDLTRARALAAAPSGPRVHEVRVEQLTHFNFPQRAVRAGSEWRMVEMVVFAYQLAFPDRTIILDTGVDKAQAEQMQGDVFDGEAWQRLQHALGAASAIYVTHEHADHIGGAFSGSLPAHLRLTVEQMNEPDRSKPVVIDAAAKSRIEVLRYDDMIALAPGLVAIKAPGHTPGSQWFFVVRDDGAELLLVGDSAWQMHNVEHVQGPPKLAGMLVKDDRSAVACQLAALHALPAAVSLIPGHDGARVKDLMQRGVLVSGFH